MRNDAYGILARKSLTTVTWNPIQMWELMTKKNTTKRIMNVDDSSSCIIPVHNSVWTLQVILI
jgi:hypothetical protein